MDFSTVTSGLPLAEYSDEITLNSEEKYYISRRKIKDIHEKWIQFLRDGG